MVFYNDFTEDDLLVGFGPQFLYDAKLYKKDELNYIKSGGQSQNNEVEVEFELRKIEEQTSDLQKESNTILQNTQEMSF